jgi:uncharacterized protein YecT (DUF1311 family)
MARSSECKEQYAQKVLDTADIVRDALWFAFPHFAEGQTVKVISENEVAQWLNQKYDCPADPPPHFWRFDLFDFKGDGNQEAIVVASTCETGTAGPDVHSVLSRDADGVLVEWKIADADPSTYDNLFGNRNYDLAVKDGTLVATFEDDPDRETAPLIIKYKKNDEEFVISSIKKTGMFRTSYDCAKAASEVERAICHVQSLASLDLQLSASYKPLASGLPLRQRDKLKAEQHDWLRQRDRECAPDKGWVSCIAGMYQNRIVELKKRASLPQAETQPRP